MPDIGEISAVDVAKPDPEDLRMYSVTTILGVLDKPALVYWAATETAKAAINQASYLEKRVQREGAQVVEKSLSNARFQRAPGQRSAAELGTAVHERLETLALTGQFPDDIDDEMLPFIEQADRWMQKFQPTYEAAEMTVYSPQFNYAGTLDAIMVVDGVRFLVDYKTSRKTVDSQGKPTSPYPEFVALQLSAYKNAEYAAAWKPRRYEYQRRRYYLLGMDERETAVEVPQVDAGLVLHITPNHCEAFPINLDQVVFDSFLYTLECFRWVNQISKTVMGNPLEKG